MHNKRPLLPHQILAIGQANSIQANAVALANQGKVSPSIHLTDLTGDLCFEAQLPEGASHDIESPLIQELLKQAGDRLMSLDKLSFDVEISSTGLVKIKPTVKAILKMFRGQGKTDYVQTLINKQITGQKESIDLNAVQQSDEYHFSRSPSMSIWQTEVIYEGGKTETPSPRGVLGMIDSMLNVDDAGYGVGHSGSRPELIMDLDSIDRRVNLYDEEGKPTELAMRLLEKRLGSSAGGLLRRSIFGKHGIANRNDNVLTGVIFGQPIYTPKSEVDLYLRERHIIPLSPPFEEKGCTLYPKAARVYENPNVLMDAVNERATQTARERLMDYAETLGLLPLKEPIDDAIYTAGLSGQLVAAPLDETQEQRHKRITEALAQLGAIGVVFGGGTRCNRPCVAICAASQVDGIICADGECDIQNGDRASKGIHFTKPVLDFNKEEDFQYFQSNFEKVFGHKAYLLKDLPDNINDMIGLYRDDEHAVIFFPDQKKMINVEVYLGFLKFRDLIKKLGRSMYTAIQSNYELFEKKFGGK